MPSLSVVIPTFNEASVLPVLLDALTHQTLRPREVIVADANSTDRTRAIAHEAGALVVDGGLPAVGRNRGAEHATGDMLLFLDADAVFSDNGFLERALREMEQSQLDIACPDLATTYGRLPALFFWLYNRYIRLVRPIHPHAVGTCIFVRRALHEKIKGFDETIRYAEDNDYGARASQVGRFGYLSERILTPPRRFERDGYLRMALLNLLAECHILLLGPIRSDVFRYRFGHGGIIKGSRE